MSQSSFGRERDDDLIPPQAFAVLVTAMLVNLNFLGSPRSIVHAARQDAWLSIILNGGLIALTACIMFALIRQHPGKTLVEITEKLLGRWLSILILLLYVCVWLFIMGATVKLQAHLFTRTLLPNTPPIVLSIYILALAVYIARHGIEPMSRLFLTLLPPFFIAVLTICIFTLSRYDTGRLLPVLEGGFRPVLQGTWITYGASYGLEFILMMGPLTTKIKGGLKATFVGIGFVVVPALFLIILLIIRFGVEGVSNLTWATLSLIETADIPGFTGFRLDPVFLGIWTLLVFCAISFHLYLTGAVFKRMLRLKDGNWPISLAAMFLLISCMININPVEIHQFLEDYLRWITPVVTFIIPTFLLALGSIKRLITGGSN